MDNPRPEKVAVVDEVRERLGAANGAILTEYRGLSVKDLATLRRSLTAAGGSYKIYKNTLVGFAVRDLGLDELASMLEGPTAIAFVDGDAVDVAKALRDFARTHPNLVVKGGLLGTSILSSADATALADLPSREVLLARFAGALAAPMVQFAGLLQALPRNLAYGLKALIDKGGAGEAPAAPPAASDTAAAAAPAPSDASAPGPPSTEQPTEGAPEPAPADAEPSAAEAPAAADAAAAPSTPEGPAPSDTPAPGTPTTEQPTEGAPEPASAAQAPPGPEPSAPSTPEPAEGDPGDTPEPPSATTD